MATQGASGDAAPYGWVVDARCGIVMMCIETGMFTYISATFTAFK